MVFRPKPTALVLAEIGEAGLNLYADGGSGTSIAGRPFKFTVTNTRSFERKLRQ
jgi:hypothetical protein